MKKVRITALMLGGVMGAAALALAACTPKVPDTEDALEIYCQDAGYGVEWCKEIIELFKEQDWVKEKYPNLEVYFASNDQESYASGRLSAGSRVNTYDLLFSMRLYNYAGPGGELLDLTDVLYNSEVPGESVLYKDKMNASYLNSNRYVDSTGHVTDDFYVTSWAGGMSSFIYNATFFEELGYEEPKTTDELLALCAAYKENSAHNGYSFYQSNDAEYWIYLFPIWWAQYEGIEEYKNFWNGISNGRYSTAIFDQKGREYSLGVYESLLDYDKGYVNPLSFRQSFMLAQTAFLQGEALMHVNGDWFNNEMKSVSDRLKSEAAADPSKETYEFKTMRMPIISALGTKLGITDAKLSEVVSYIDAVADGEEAEVPEINSTSGYSAEDVIAKVREARTIVYSVGSEHTAVIPSYATAKKVAVDFLRFMATDIALNAYTKATGGASLPMNYTVDAELYAQLDGTQKSRLDYFQSGLDVYTLPAEMSFPLARFGGLTAFVTEHYYNTFSAQGNTKTPADFMAETKSAWTQQKFDSALDAAGLV